MTSTIGLGVLWGCGDGEESPPTEPAGGSAGTSSSEGGGGGDDGGTSAGGTSAAGNGGSSGAGTAGDGGTAGSAGTGGSSSQAGDTSVDGGEPGGGSGGAAGEGGGGAGAGGEGGAPGPHIGPVLDYDFDAGLGLTVLDSSGNALNGVLSVAAWSPQGRNGASLLLLGGLLPTTYVTVPAGVFTDAKATTIAAWVKLTANAPWHRIFDFGNGAADAANRFMYLTPNNGTGLRFSYFGGDATTREATVTTAATLPLNLWKHVAVTMAASGEQMIYVDGFPAGKNASVAIPPSELEPLAAVSWLGKSRFDSDAGFAGQMDDFKVYDRVLAPAEIATLAFPKSDYTRIPFDEGTGATSDDVSERGVDATLSDGVTWASGRLGAAAVLSGDAQYVTLGNPIAGCTDELTIALWVRHDEARPWSRIFDFGGTLDNFMFLAPSGPEGKLQLSIFRGGTTETVIVSATTVPANGTWHHVGVTISTTVATVFIDGESVGSVTDPKTPAMLGATNEHWLGKSRFGTDPYFKGAFDEVRIACRAFTPDEIKNLAFR